MSNSNEKESVPIGAQVSPEFAERLTNDAAKMTYDDPGDTSKSDIIREALAEYYGIPVEEIEP